MERRKEGEGKRRVSCRVKKKDMCCQCDWGMVGGVGRRRVVIGGEVVVAVA